MFVRAPNPVWYFPDLIGFPLNDEYYAFFLQNTFPYQPQDVYRDPQGMTVWTGDKIQFYPNGTLPNNLYFDPNLVYRIEIRHGDSQFDQLIYEINNFVPGNGSSPSGQSLALFPGDNQVSNPSFSLVNFETSITITDAGSHLIAPGWELVLEGAGSSVVTQLPLVGDQNFLTNPPYAIRIANTGWSNAFLRQRLENNGAIWANGAVSASVTGRANFTTQSISVLYVPSDQSDSPPPHSTYTIIADSLTTAAYQVLSAAINIDTSQNIQDSDTAYVDIIIALPTTGSVDLSNIQIIGQTQTLDTSPAPSNLVPKFQQETKERLVDHLFHYYKSQLVTKPKDTLLVGWNFPQNPYQFINSTVATVTAQCSYIADQTILYQNAGSQVQSGKNVVAQRENLLIKAVDSATDTRFALIQYIDPKSIKPYWSYVLSAFARAKLFTSHATSIRLKCRLIYRSSLPSTIGNAEPIASWPSNSDPVFSAGWSSLSPLNDPSYIISGNYSDDESPGKNSYDGYSFDHFNMPDSNNANMTLGIVIYTMDSMNASSGSEDSIAFDRVSLIPSYFGADSSPQTDDEVYRSCEFYYEKSYSPGVLPGTVTDAGVREYPAITIVNGGDIDLYEWGFDLQYNSIKRAQPSSVKFYSTDGTVDKVRLAVWNGTTNPAPAAGSNPANVNSSDFTFIANDPHGLVTQPTATSATMKITGTTNTGVNRGQMFFQYTADARLGV